MREITVVDTSLGKASEQAVAKSRSYPVRRVRRCRRLFEPKLLLYHKSHLVFGGVTIAHHRLLNLSWRILSDINVVVCGRQKNSASGMPKLKCALGVLSLENLLDRNYYGLMPCN
jgi:hypothetical protein